MFTKRFVLKLLVAVFLIALVAAAIYSRIPRGSGAERGTALLLEAFGKRRLIEPRLSGGFKCGEFNPSPNATSGINTAKLDKARSLILDAVDGGDSSSQLAYARLLLSKSEKLPDALKYLRRVLAASDSAEAHNDLGVCLIQEGKLEDAIDEFKVTLKLKPDMPEAVFNSGLCYQRLLLSDAATAEYDRVLAVEHDRGWMEEINQRRQEVSRDLSPQKNEAEILAPLDAAIEAGNLDEARKFAAEQFESLVGPASFALPIRYLTCSKDGNLTQAERTLSEIELIGEEFERAMGDSSVTDLASYLSNLSPSEKTVELGLISDYLDATDVFSTRQYAEGETRFARLSGLFKERGNAVFESLSINDLASCLSYAGSLKASLDALQGSIARFEPYRWPFRHAMLTTTLALTHSRLGEDSNAISDCRRALELYRNAPRGRAKVRQIMGLAYRHLGDLEGGLACLTESTGLFRAGPTDWAELAYNYLSSSDFQRLRGNHSLALLYAQEAIKFSRLSKSPNRSAQALSFAALEQARLDRFEQAQALLDAAFDSVTRIPQSQRNYTEQLVLTRAAEFAARRGDITRSVECYTKAEALLMKTSEGREIPLINVLRGRGEAYFAGREFDKASIDLSRAIGLIESYRSRITDAKNRSDYLDASHSVFDRLISLDVRGFGRQTEAFQVSEQSRARTLLDELSLHDPTQRGGTGERKAGVSGVDRPVRPLGLAEVQRPLPADLTLVSYSVTDQGTFAFIVTHSSLDTVELTATAETLDRLVNNYVSDLQSKAPLEEVSQKALELYGYLIEPLRSKLGGFRRLCIVPDKALHFLPFAALVDREGRYLVESYSLSSAPSASALVRCLKESGEKHTTGDAKILAVGNPAFDHDAFPLLPDLPDSEREAKQSAAFYGSNKVVLTGADANERRLRAELEDCDVAHLAVHCLVEAESALAALVLAPNRGRGVDVVPGSQPSAEDGLLSLNEIYGMSLPKTKLVVLSACQSGLGRYYRGEGIVSLVRPFLALRVPTVVASLWSVDSQSTASLMIEFQKQIRTANAGPSEALRISQIQMAGSEEHKHPYYWAPFTVIGAY